MISIPLSQHWKQLLSIATKFSSKFRLAFLRIIQKIKDSVVRESLEDALSSGNITYINSKLPWDDLEADLKSDFEKLYIEVLTESGISSSRAIGSKYVTDSLAQYWASKHAAELVTSVTQESKNAIRRTIANGLKNGLPKARLADEIKQNIGLTERQAQSLENFRQGLIQENMKPGTIEKLVNKKRRVMLAERSRLIADTESQIASNQGFKLAAEQAKRRGEISDDMEMSWKVTPDDRLCDVCRPLSDIRAPIGGLFQGNIFPPLHPRCRCVAVLKKKK